MSYFLSILTIFVIIFKYGAMSNNPIKLLTIENSGIRPQIDNLFMAFSIDEINHHELLSKLKIPQKLYGAIVTICEQGSMQIIINAKMYQIVKGDMLVILPEFIFQVLSYSDDVRFYVIGVNWEFIAKVAKANAMQVFLQIKTSPCIAISDQDMGAIVNMSEMIRAKSEHKENIYISKIAQSLLTAMFYEVSNIYAKTNPIIEVKVKRADEIFLQFMNLIGEYCVSERSLQFYASKIYITAKHLSYVIESVSGIPAVQWISNAVIVYARSLLLSNMTINQVSDYLNFPNPSFFSQYFKRHTGISPKAVKKFS